MIRKSILLISVCFIFLPNTTLANTYLDSDKSANKACHYNETLESSAAESPEFLVIHDTSDTLVAVCS